MFSDNPVFVELFTAYFKDPNLIITTFPNGKSLHGSWLYCKKDVKKFLKLINASDKINVHNWLRLNALVFWNMSKFPIRESITLDYDGCSEIFFPNHENMWRIWEKICQKDPVKFAKIVSVQDKILLTFWYGPEQA